MVAARGVTSIATILREYLRGRDIDARTRQEQVRLSWKEIVGEVIARVSSVHRIADGVAYVGCATPVWAQTLSLRRTEILAKIAEHVGTGAIQDIRFSSVPAAGEDAGYAGTSRPRQRHREKALTDAQEQTIAAIAASLREKAE